MPAIDFDSMPDSARLWIFGASRELTHEEAERLLSRVDTFLEGWNAHGHPVVGGREWRHDRFLLIAADEEATGVSGCSIDSLYRTLRDAENELGATLLDSSLVWYREVDGTVRSLPRPDFREHVAAGHASDRTPVFDNTAATVGALRSGEWERPMAESWHGKAFAAAR